ncbi:hypothetical protein FB45DRAFT_320687 [Roridomyces roridus]|uniref:Uncharacterized protein n=1 Tax=Roridomyces roridus TaxID=1738132 RepID=A0AAD7F9W4_9AGAR|nr:hypothetical protein FB45DRAFT_320687 [Roridomyces roridus]
MTMGMGGLQSSFYATPAFPPPPLATVRVPMLRHLFTDIAIEPLASGRGTPVDRGRWASWGGRQMMMAMQGLGPAIGTGRLESRVPQYQRYVDAPAEVSTPMPMPVEEQQTMPMPVGMPGQAFEPDEALWQRFRRASVLRAVWPRLECLLLMPWTWTLLLSLRRTTITRARCSWNEWGWRSWSWSFSWVPPPRAI